MSPQMQMCNMEKKKKVLIAKAGNTTNLRAESCSVFDCKKRGSQASSSQHSSPPLDVTDPQRSGSEHPPPDSASSKSTNKGAMSGILTGTFVLCYCNLIRASHSGLNCDVMLTDVISVSFAAKLNANQRLTVTDKA